VKLTGAKSDYISVLQQKALWILSHVQLVSINESA